MNNKTHHKKRIESWLTIAAIASIIIAWFVGGQLESEDIITTIKTKMPEISKLEEIEIATYKIYSAEDVHIGYVTIESSMGYGGPLQMATAVDSNGKIFDVAVVNSKETPSYLEKVLETDFLDKIKGRSYDERYAVGLNVDAISSATYSSRAILEAAKKGNRFVAAKILGLEVPKAITPAIQFGAPEAILLLLFAIGYFAHKKTFKYKKAARWITMLTGLIFIGFYFNKPFSLSMMNQLLLGYFPPLHSHVYWYLLLGGVFLVFTIDNKNPYCTWFCPFGAAQEFMGMVGGAKNVSVGRFKNVFKWALRITTLLAIIIALLLRNPGVTSYEVFGTLFKLTGSNFQFALLGIVLITSIFVKRPWCNYLCPLGPVIDHYTALRKIIINKWIKQKASK